ncbi:MAG TPA: hypothetical protein HA321_00875 [Halobacteriales archaeon]|nr:hypothetical protein [Halobacteriales archaeon]
MKILSAVLGSPFSGSSSEKIVNLFIDRLPKEEWNTAVLDLSDISSEALLFRSKDNILSASIERILDSDVILAATPTYRATYTGLIKTFFDQFPENALSGKVVLPIQTGGSAEHALSIEHGLSPMVRTLGAAVASKVIYSWSEHWNEDGTPSKNLEGLIDQSVKEIIGTSG